MQPYRYTEDEAIKESALGQLSTLLCRQTLQRKTGDFNNEDHSSCTVSMWSCLLCWGLCGKFFSVQKMGLFLHILCVHTNEGLTWIVSYFFTICRLHSHCATTNERVWTLSAVSVADQWVLACSLWPKNILFNLIPPLNFLILRHDPIVQRIMSYKSKVASVCVLKT